LPLLSKKGGGKVISEERKKEGGGETSRKAEGEKENTYKILYDIWERKRLYISIEGERVKP